MDNKLEYIYYMRFIIHIQFKDFINIELSFIFLEGDNY